MHTSRDVYKKISQSHCSVTGSQTSSPLLIEMFKKKDQNNRNQIQDATMTMCSTSNDNILNTMSSPIICDEKSEANSCSSDNSSSKASPSVHSQIVQTADTLTASKTHTSRGSKQLQDNGSLRDVANISIEKNSNALGQGLGFHKPSAGTTRWASSGRPVEECSIHTSPNCQVIVSNTDSPARGRHFFEGSVQGLDSGKTRVKGVGGIKTSKPGLSSVVVTSSVVPSSLASRIQVVKGNSSLNKAHDKRVLSPNLVREMNHRREKRVWR